MWPWDHLAVAYLWYSGLRRLRGRPPPTDAAAVAVVVGSQFPDLVDKPLSWTLALFPVFAHTLVVAVPLSLVVLFVSRRAGTADVGWGFVAGYLLHLVGDLLFPLVTDGVLGYRRLLWPFVPFRGMPGIGLVEATLQFLDSYTVFLASPAAAWFVAADLTLLACAAALWVADGRPGLSDR